MGYTSYSSIDRSTRVSAQNYSSKSVNEIFKQRSTSNQMDPKGAKMREARDSEEHPNSVPIILALDVTGSMGVIPRQLIIDGLPTIMGTIIEAGIPDPQLLFLAIGDHKCDEAPLQVGQFESGDELLDQWLTKVWVEGNGGGNGGESYALAHYFAAFHTVTDSFEKRKQKGYLFTIGDEPVHKEYPSRMLKNLMGTTGVETKDYTAAELLAEAQKTYNVYHLHLSHSYGGEDRVANGWRELLGDNLIVVTQSEIPKTIARIVYESVNAKRISGVNSENPVLGPSKDNPPQMF